MINYFYFYYENFGFAKEFIQHEFHQHKSQDDPHQERPKSLFYRAEPNSLNIILEKIFNSIRTAIQSFI